MPRTKTVKAAVDFRKGLYSDSSGLNYPEGSLVVADNVRLNPDGSTQRRLGIKSEVGGSSIQVSKTESTVSGLIAYSVHQYLSAALDANRNYLLFQVGNSLVVKKLFSGPVSTSAATDSGAQVTIDISQYANRPDYLGGTEPVFSETAGNAAYSVLSSANGGGKLWFTSRAHLPFVVWYDKDSDTFKHAYLGSDPDTGDTSMFIRDYNGIQEGVSVSYNPTELTPFHLYNLRNQGWSDTNIQAFYNSYSSDPKYYPNNTMQWILGKNASDDFDPSLLKKQDWGDSPAPKGRFKIHPLLGSRDGLFTTTISGFESPNNFNGTKDEKSSTGFSSVAFFSGRVVLGGDENKHRPNGVYFSKVIEKLTDAGCFGQINDPTSEHFTDLLATDGFVVYVPGANKILSIQPILSGVAVIATNGVWYINSGSSGVFSATDYSVDKISSAGGVSSAGVVQAEGVVHFAGESALYSIQPTEGQAYPTVIDISGNQILELYSSISQDSKSGLFGVYDKLGKSVLWFYGPNSGGFHYTASNALVYNMTTGAYSTMSFYQMSSSVREFGIFGAIPTKNLVEARVPSVVTVSGQEVTVDGEVVVTGEAYQGGSARTHNLYLFVVSNEHADTGAFVHICEFSSLSFMDFTDVQNPVSSSGIDYTSTLQLAPEVLGTLGKEKSVLYVSSFLKSTEASYLTLSGGGTLYDRPSGVTLRICWDWHKSSSGHKWSTPEQAYRFKVAPTLFGGIVSTSESVLVSRLRGRGRGTAMSLRYDSQTGKDFVLLGSELSATVDATEE